MKKKIVIAFVAGAVASFAAVGVVLNSIFDPSNDESFYNPNP